MFFVLYLKILYNTNIVLNYTVFGKLRSKLCVKEKTSLLFVRFMGPAGFEPAADRL